MKIEWITKPQFMKQYVEEHDKLWLWPTIEHWIDFCVPEGVIQYPVVFALLLYGEARGEGYLGLGAVGEVVVNRCVRRDSLLVENECFRPYQFSCFNRGDKSLAAAIEADHETVLAFCNMAKSILHDVGEKGIRNLKPDVTLYLTERALRAQAVKWAKLKIGAWDFSKLKPRGQIGNHLFFAE